MATNQGAQVGLDVVDYHATFGYPAADTVVQVKSDLGEAHMIWTITAAANLATNYASAPNGTVVHGCLAGSQFVAVKSGALGSGIAGTWHYQAVNT